ncbi:MAG: hypothetical protein ABI867_25240 [Kofleriaceae bacterium]
MERADRIAGWLREMARLSATEESPMPRGVDMTPRAIAGRLREMAEISELCRRLSIDQNKPS